MLRTRLEWAQERQRVLSERTSPIPTRRIIAGRDLKAPKFADPSQLTLAPVASVSFARTENAHIAGVNPGGSAFRTEKGNYEVRPTAIR